jgi:hypothetical protein
MRTVFFWMAVQRIEGYDRLIVRWWWFAAAIATLMIVLALWKLVVVFTVWWNRPRVNPIRLFQQLARLHRLTKQEIKLLRNLSAKLPNEVHAAILYVDPATWCWSQIDETDMRNALEKVYEKIFGFPPDLRGI